MEKNRKKQGFTLMELLVVVAIIAILVAIAIPTFNSTLDRARQAADDANARSLKATVTMTELLDQIPTLSGSVSAKELMAACGSGDHIIKYYYTTGGSMVLGDVDRFGQGTNTGSIQSLCDLLGIGKSEDLLALNRAARESGYRAQSAGESRKKDEYLCMTVTATQTSVTRVISWEEY